MVDNETIQADNNIGKEEHEKIEKYESLVGGKKKENDEEGGNLGSVPNSDCDPLTGRTAPLECSAESS